MRLTIALSAPRALTYELLVAVHKFSVSKDAHILEFGESFYPWCNLPTAATQTLQVDEIVDCGRVHKRPPLASERKMGHYERSMMYALNGRPFEMQHFPTQMPKHWGH